MNRSASIKAAAGGGGVSISVHNTPPFHRVGQGDSMADTRLPFYKSTLWEEDYNTICEAVPIGALQTSPFSTLTSTLQGGIMFQLIDEETKGQS